VNDVHEWLAAGSRGVPPALAQRLRESVVTSAGSVDDLLSAGERLLKSAIVADPMTRTQALDVLGADALVTYAFEAAADEPGQLAARADSAMRRIAAVAADVE
jgi:hypothetical protein